VREEEVEERVRGMEKVFSRHVYSIQMGETIHASSLYATDLEVYKASPLSCCQHSSITNPAAVARDAAPPPKIAPGVAMVKEIKKEVKKPGGIESAFSKTKKDEPAKAASVSASRPEKTEKPKEEKKASSVSSGSKKPSGGIANFFAAQAAKPKVEKKEDKPVVKEKKSEEKDVKSEEKENVENDKKTKVEVKKKPAATKKTEIKSFGKKDKEEVKALDDSKKRKRIQVMSESEDEEEEEERKVEEEEAPPPQAKLLESESEDEVIPATPKEKTASRKGRRRVKRQVDKTYVDSEGYMVTKKVVESASETDEEPEETKAKVETVEPKAKKEVEAPAAKKTKLAAPGAKKQQGIASFFSKK